MCWVRRALDLLARDRSRNKTSHEEENTGAGILAASVVIPFCQLRDMGTLYLYLGLDRLRLVLNGGWSFIRRRPRVMKQGSLGRVGVYHVDPIKGSMSSLQDILN